MSRDLGVLILFIIASYLAYRELRVAQYEAACRRAARGEPTSPSFRGIRIVIVRTSRTRHRTFANVLVFNQRAGGAGPL